MSSRALDVLVAVRNPRLVTELRDSLAGTNHRLLGVIDPLLPGAVGSWQNQADAMIISASDLDWLRQQRPGSVADFAMERVVLVVSTIGQLLDSLSLSGRVLGIIFDPHTTRHASIVLDLAVEGSGYIVFPSGLVRLLLNDGLRCSMVRELTAKERRTLVLLGQARSNREIAELTRLSEAQVKMVVRSLLMKLRLKNRTAAAVFATRHAYVVQDTHPLDS